MQTPVPKKGYHFGPETKALTNKTHAQAHTCPAPETNKLKSIVSRVTFRTLFFLGGRKPDKNEVKFVDGLSDIRPSIQSLRR